MNTVHGKLVTNGHAEVVLSTGTLIAKTASQTAHAVALATTFLAFLPIILLAHIAKHFDDWANAERS